MVALDPGWACACPPETALTKGLVVTYLSLDRADPAGGDCGQRRSRGSGRVLGRDRAVAGVAALKLTAICSL